MNGGATGWTEELGVPMNRYWGESKRQGMPTEVLEWWEKERDGLKERKAPRQAAVHSWCLSGVRGREPALGIL